MPHPTPFTGSAPLDGHVDEDAIRTAVDGLSLQRKIELLSGAAQFALAEAPEIGLAGLVLSDGPTGVRGPVVVGGRQGCLLPNASLLAQSWDPDVLDRAGDILAEEAIQQRTHVVLGPTINLHRTPLGGRLFEAFSEDPYLTGRLAAAYVRALQARGIGASVKHFLGNESETQRTSVDVRIDQATLREVYLKPFEIAVQDAHPWTVMAAYNLVDGTPSTEHRRLITDVLKDEWEYDGVVMSDWYATSSSEASANAGLDLVMPGPDTPWSRDLAADIARGRVSEASVNDKVLRLLRLAARVGGLGTHRAWDLELPHPASATRREELTTLAARGMVVLKNEDRALPLAPVIGDRVVVVGRHATDTIAQGGGSAQVHPPHVVSIAEGLRDIFGDRLEVVDGVETRAVLPAAAPNSVYHPITGAPGVRVRVFDTSDHVAHDRHLDIAELEDSMSGWLQDAARIELSARLRLDTAQDLQIGVRGPGRWHLQSGDVDLHVHIPYHDGPGGGFFRPRSHAVTTRVEPGQVITATVERDEMPRILGLAIAPARRPAGTAISAAASAAVDADVAIVVVGLTPDQETEGQDKDSLALPGDQDALVTAVAAVARRTVVVVNAATPVLMPWSGRVDAIVFAGLPGQESGHAVAAALTGRILPEGRLVTTFPAADRQGPAWSPVPTGGKLDYTEGPFVGYRGWASDVVTPAYWFGHGLGLTTWEWVDAVATWDGDTAQTVTLTVCNTGQWDGIETVQAYLAPDDPTQPVRLIGWNQVALSPGSEARLAVTCDPRMQVRWDVDRSQWKPVGPGTVLLARGLGDVRDRLPGPRSTGSGTQPSAHDNHRTEA